MLAYSVLADECDEYVRVGENIVLEAMKQWVTAIHSCFSETYLQQQMCVDIEKQMQINNDRGFPRMFASLDCMHWNWNGSFKTRMQIVVLF